METMTFGVNHTIVIAILAYFFARWLTRRVSLLDIYRIPEAVTGGLCIAVGVALVRSFAEIEIVFSAGQLMLLAFFATIGLNARIGDLAAGGRPLVVALAVTVAALLLQNVIGVAGAIAFGGAPVLGLMGGSVALIGGHGTAAAWAPIFETVAPAAGTIGLAAATFGLVAGGVFGGPLGRFLITRHKLESERVEDFTVGVPEAEEATHRIGASDIFSGVLVIALAIGLGEQINHLAALAGLKLPSFVTALFAGIIIGNLGPRLIPNVVWPMHGPALALLAELALNLFLVRALMSLQLWTLVNVAGPLSVVLACQVLAMLLVATFVLFPLLGRSYDSAVMSAGFVGLTLGATPTAVANMTALTDRFGVSPLAFLVIPLVGAFFIDLVNAATISTLVAVMGLAPG